MTKDSECLYKPICRRGRLEATYWSTVACEHKERHQNHHFHFPTLSTSKANVLLLLVETESHCVAQAGGNLSSLLRLPSDCRCASPALEK